jgi:DNA helicase II / ATP-dependent DNA helicase PcrA
MVLTQRMFSTLNPQQQAAVAHRGGPLLVLAGAGTGKTTTLAARVAQRVLDGADPGRLLLLTFSRRAAQALADRAGRLLHQALGWPATQAAPVLPWAGTFHGVAARLLREAAPQVGLAPQFTIVDRGDAEALMGLSRERLGLAHGRDDSHPGRRRFPLPATCLAIHSRCVNTQAPLARVLQSDYPWCAEHQATLQQLFGSYAADKAAQATLDYDDLLLAWWHLLQDAGWAAHLGQRFDEVLVDEYQDTNRLQAAILRSLKPDGRGLTVVGDDAQSIYRFRGAEVANILGFANGFNPAAAVVTLARNYRSSQPILDAANAAIALSPEALPKALQAQRPGGQRPQLVSVADELAQARHVTDQALRWREEGLRLKQQAVLFRTSHHSAALELALTRRNIPFVKFGGLKFLEATHLKDLLAVLRWAHNPRGRLAGFRVLQLVPGIGPALARRLVDAVQSAAQPWAELQQAVVPAAAHTDFAALQALMATLASDASPWPAELATVQDWYTPHLQRLHPDSATVRLADLAQLQVIARGYRNRERFITELTLDPPEASSDWAGPPHQDDDYLILSTLHSAKGQEWDAVSILNVVDGCLPADLATGDAAQVEEERRLLYVGLTRARHHLQLLVPLRFHVTQQPRHGDRHLWGGLSRFIAPEVARCFDRVAVEAPDSPPSAALPAAGKLQLASRLGAAWD